MRDGLSDCTLNSTEVLAKYAAELVSDRSNIKVILPNVHFQALGYEADQRPVFDDVDCEPDGQVEVFLIATWKSS